MVEFEVDFRNRIEKEQVFFSKAMQFKTTNSSGYFMRNFFIGLALSAFLTQAAAAQWALAPLTPDRYISDIAIQSDTVYLATLGSGVYRSANNMVSWDNLYNGLDSIQSRAVYQILVDGPILIIATQDGIYKSTDSGQNWFRSSDGIFVGNGAWYAFTESIVRIDSTLFTGAWAGIFRSTDGGDNWLPSNISGQDVLAKNFTMHNGTLFAARESINTPYGYKSTNGGLSWQSLTTITMPTITFLSEPPNIWSGTIEGVWLSTNNGANWAPKMNGLPLDPYNSSIIRVNGTMVTSVKFGGSGVLVSRDDGVLWEDFGQGLPFLSDIEELIVYGNKILAATSDGLYQRDISDIPTGIESEDNNLPGDFYLSQNYPNPFNPSTVIEYSIPSPLHVTLKVFDIVGREVTTLIDEDKSSGNYQATFDASTLSGGLYFYKLQAGRTNITKKAILLK
jgi:hypothetical protein